MAFIKPADAAKAAGNAVAVLGSIKAGTADIAVSDSMERLKKAAEREEAKRAALLFAPGLDKECTPVDSREVQALSWKRLAADRAGRCRMAARYVLACAGGSTDDKLTAHEVKGKKVCESSRKDMATVRAELGACLIKAGVDPNNTMKVSAQQVTLAGWLEVFWMVTRAIAVADGWAKAQAAA